MTRPGVLCGAQAEARLLRALPGPPPLVACSGANAERARALAQELAARGATGLVSFGLAAGLTEGMAAGTLLLPAEILLTDGSPCPIDPGWREAVLARAAGLRLSQERVACAGRVLATPADKRALAERGAAAADMESEAVAVAARRAGLPFLVLRAVADPWNTAVPAAALAGLGEDGALRPGGIVLSLLRKPQHLPDLLRLARDSRAGLAALDEILRRLGFLVPP